jgi:hypothetical protein
MQVKVRSDRTRSALAISRRVQVRDRDQDFAIASIC